MSVLSSEWVKVRSVRSTHLVLGLSLSAVLLGASLAWAAVGMYDSAPPQKQVHASIANLEEVFLIVPQLCMGVLGVLSITSEYVTGLIGSSLSVVPRRWPILAGKSAVVSAIALVTAPLATFGTYFVSRWLIGDRFQGAYMAPFADRLPTLATSSISVVVFALLGLGLGAILRSAAAAITVLVGLVYVLPMIVGNLPAPWSERIGSVMIGALPREITGNDNTNSVYGSLLSPGAATATLVAYAVLPLLVAAWLLRRRDV
jgi:ABC-2 type transport system permease protein